MRGERGEGKTAKRPYFIVILPYFIVIQPAGLEEEKGEGRWETGDGRHAPRIVTRQERFATALDLHRNSHLLS
jgi:hypothetical protein